VFAFLEESKVGFDRFFFDWYGGAASESRARAGPARSSYEGERFAVLRRAFDDYTPTHPELLRTPYFEGDGPCSLLIDEIEAIWASIADKDDWRAFDAKIESIRAMPRLSG
jgi:hypothetical protein